jgi:hypothetical protein
VNRFWSQIGHIGVEYRGDEDANEGEGAASAAVDGEGDWS